MQRHEKRMIVAYQICGSGRGDGIVPATLAARRLSEVSAAPGARSSAILSADSTRS
jgi:hypothetical protein